MIDVRTRARQLYNEFEGRRGVFVLISEALRQEGYGDIPSGTLRAWCSRGEWRGPDLLCVTNLVPAEFEVREPKPIDRGPVPNNQGVDAAEIAYLEAAITTQEAHRLIRRKLPSIPLESVKDIALIMSSVVDLNMSMIRLGKFANEQRASGAKQIDVQPGEAREDERAQDDDDPLAVYHRG